MDTPNACVWYHFEVRLMARRIPSPQTDRVDIHRRARRGLHRASGDRRRTISRHLRIIILLKTILVNTPCGYMSGLRPVYKETALILLSSIYTQNYIETTLMKFSRGVCFFFLSASRMLWAEKKNAGFATTYTTTINFSIIYIYIQKNR